MNDFGLDLAVIGNGRSAALLDPTARIVWWCYPRFDGDRRYHRRPYDLDSESAGVGRNWDYRYCWLRDAYFVVKALNRHGATQTMEDFISFILGIASAPWLLHFRLDLAEFARRDLTGYMRVNDHFATELEKIIEPDDLIWVHDYHMIPIADALRRRGHANRIGFFLHVPMPPPELLASLPNHEQLIPLLLQYDVVGFQTEGDSGNFVRYLMAENEDSRREMRVLETSGHQISFTSNGRQTRVGSFPVGIEPRQFQVLARRSVRSPLVKDLVTSLGGRTLIIGVDRLDYSKGLVQRLEAFEIFLARNPEWHGKVTYLQITPKNRSEIPEYLELAQAVGSIAGRINGKYGEVSWTPIRYVNRVYSRSVLAGLFRTARVGLVTPLRDGMNLVAKEYVAAQDPDDPGVLILSRFAGAAVDGKRALLVNPYDAESVAGAIAQALAMPLDERRERHAALLHGIIENDVNKWQKDFLDALRNEHLTAAETRSAMQMSTPDRQRTPHRRLAE